MMAAAPLPQATATPEALLQVRQLVKHYPLRAGGGLRAGHASVKAVDGVSFDVRAGETFGLVGESGCGKSTLGRLVIRLEEPTSGQVSFGGQDILALNHTEMKRMRREMQIVFQDPFASLNPRMTVGEIVGEPFAIHGIARGAERSRRVAELLEAVGLAANHASRHPHEFSGGQRQRIGIARAIALRPKLIVCDEPVSALDVSIQSQVLNLLSELQREFGVAYLFIAHGLAAVRHISDRVGVMYLGKLVEVAPVRKLFAGPLHPYTQVLMSAIPVPDPRVRRERIILQGDVPSPVNPPSGCRFHTRCPFAAQVGERCRIEEPKPVIVDTDHIVACHLRSGLPAEVEGGT
jgi:oligopeptide transport system ATP-binding protein